MKKLIFQPYEFLDTGLLSENLLYYDKVVLWISQVNNLISQLGLNEFEKALEAGVFKFVDTNAHLLSHYNNQTKDQCINDSLDDLRSNMPSYVIHENRNLSLNDAESIADDVIAKCSRYLTFVDGKKENMSEKVLKATIRDERELEIPEYLNDIAMNALFTRQRLFTINLELAMLEKIGAQNFVSTPDLMILHSSKFQTANLLGRDVSDQLKPDQNRTFILDLLSLEGIPDLGKLIDNKMLAFSEILEVRETKDGALFRNWFHKTLSNNNNLIDNNKSIVEIYCDVLKKKNVANSLTFKALRMAVSATIGAINPVLGLAASGADTFLLDKILAGWKPSYFLHDKLFTTIAPRLFKKGAKPIQVRS